MRVLCCLDGSNTERLAEHTFTLLSIHDAQILLLHVVDSGPSDEIEHLRKGYFGLGQQGAELLALMALSEQEQGEEILTAARTVFRIQWPGGTPGAGQIEAMMLRGKPEQEIVRLAASRSIDLIVLCNRRVRGPREPLHPPGPKSVGHIARFVLDHAPCPVLLLRP
jgi:nucleotide-binding universal stress UspA family protein